MFYYIEGNAAEIEPNLVVLDCGGIGYALNTTTNTISYVKKGERTKLYVSEIVKEDAFDLYGFYSKAEKRFFEMLTSVSGIGPKAALSILSANTPDGLALAVSSGNEKALTVAPGIGKKIAQRVILELKDKLGANLELDFSSGPVSVPAPDSGMALAMAGLAELGYSQAEITSAMKKIPPETTRTEDIIRQALRAMAMP